MSSLIVDASVVIDALSEVASVRERLADAIAFGEIHSPHLIDVEVIHAIRRAVFRAEIDLDEGNRRIDVFMELPITRHSHVRYISRIWELRAKVTAYDAAYVALAESLDAPLWTRDARLARSSGHTARIEYIA